MLFIAGLAVGFFVGLLTPFIAYAAFGGDRPDNARDEHAEPTFVGGGADFIDHCGSVISE